MGCAPHVQGGPAHGLRLLGGSERSRVNDPVARVETLEVTTNDYPELYPESVLEIIAGCFRCGLPITGDRLLD